MVTNNSLELALGVISVNVFVILFLWGYLYERKNKNDLLKEDEQQSTTIISYNDLLLAVEEPIKPLVSMAEIVDADKGNTIKIK